MLTLSSCSSTNRIIQTNHIAQCRMWYASQGLIVNAGSNGTLLEVLDVIQHARDTAGALIEVNAARNLRPPRRPRPGLPYEAL